MTTPQPQARRCDGSVLVITLLIALLLGMVLASYLLLVRAQSVSVARSQAWHAALGMAEAGVEEALAKLNTLPFATNVTEAWSATNSLAGGNYAVSYAANLPPVIYSTGYAEVPALSATLTRTLRVQTDLLPLFFVGAEVEGAIRLNGHNLTSDGYNSDNPFYSDEGKYVPGGNTTDNGDIASTVGLADVSSANIRGKLFVGAASTNQTGTGFYVKDGIAHDFNAEYPEVPAPSFGGSSRAPPTSSAYTYSLSGFNYRTNYLKGSVIVNPSSQAVLHLTGYAAITNLVVSKRSSLRIYAGGTNTTIIGQISLLEEGKPKDFQYYGLPGNTSIILSGVSNFIGTIYAPNACLTVESGGVNTLDFQGALTVGELNLKTHFNLHYDEFLRRAPEYAPTRGFIVTNWTELPPP